MYRLLFSAVLARRPAETAHRARVRADPVGCGGSRHVVAAARVAHSGGPGAAGPGIRPWPPGPLGLAAGFDKDALGPDALGMLGFAFVEVGTVTAQPQPGNPKPRMFRLPRDRALINRMGFNNHGAAAAAERLRSRRGRSLTVGANIGKTKAVPESEAAGDYPRARGYSPASPTTW